MADKFADKPATATYIIDRPVYQTPGKPPHLVGSEQELNIDEVAHLVTAGFIHRKGTAPVPSAASAGQQQVIQPEPPQTIAPPMPAAPLNYQSKPPAA